MLSLGLYPFSVFVNKVGTFTLRKGYIGDLRLADGEPALKVLEGDPRYQAIQARMIDNLNTQRAALGLKPA